MNYITLMFRFSKTHGKYTEEDLDVKLTHVPPKEWMDHIALGAVKLVRFGFDNGEFYMQYMFSREVALKLTTTVLLIYVDNLSNRMEPR